MFHTHPAPVRVSPARWRTTQGHDEFTPALHLKQAGRAGITVRLDQLDELIQQIEATERLFDRGNTA